MAFKKDDIQNLLFEGNNRSGYYNQMQWSIHPGSDYTDIVARVISIHEFLHNELNNITAYGFLLLGYAYLSGEGSAKQKYYRNMLGSLVARCRTAHEAYATWVGLTVFKKDLHDDLHLEVLDGNEEYMAYYNKAERLVENLKSLFIKQQVVTAAIRFCFQSKILAEYGINNLDSFRIDEVEVTEFPDNRFQYITEALPENFFSDCVTAFIDNMSVPHEQSLLRDAWNGKDNTAELLKMENDHLAHALMNSVYTKLDAHFDQLGCPSLADKEDHLGYYKRLLIQLDNICPLKNSKNPLFLNNAPDDYNRSVLLNFENETVMLSSFALPCIILRPEEMNKSTKDWLLKGIGAEPHLFIMGRYSLFLENQYRFKYKEDEEWFEHLKGPFTAIRYAGNVDGERIIFIIPFENPEQLTAFLADKAADLAILGCVSISAAYHSEWWQRWGDFFADYCSFSCLLTDISPLYYIERVFPGEETVSYTKIIVTAEKVIYTAILFQVMEAGKINALMLMPGTDMYCHVLHYYIQSKYPSFINANAVTADIGKFLPVILSHVMREEHTYYYRSQNINFE